MFRYFKLKIRKIIPDSFQVPLKYWYCFARGFIEPEMALLKKIIRPSSVAIDIGGNRGIYSYYISKLCKRIEIFEPNPTCFNILESWASSIEGINVHNLALSSEEGISKLFIPIDIDGVEHDSSGSIQKNTSANSRFEMVELQRLDAFRFEKIDFIPICFKIFCISLTRLLSLFAKSPIPLKIDIPFVKAAITNNIGYSSVEFT